jgi:serine/threonine-protein kinase
MVERHLPECDECRSLVGAVLRSSGMMRAVKIPSPEIDVIAPTTPVLPVGETAAASPVLAPVKAGDVLAGKYVVERVLGAGGMGVVVAARHLQLEQRFALKFLLPDACKAPDAVARFLREGKAAARITSEHVARVVDTGVLDTGSPYLVLEYLEGADLGASPEPLAVEDAVEYVLQACEAIVEAHALGIIHRDLKPANLFLARRKDGSPLVKVLDFGISKAMEESGAGKDLTGSATMMGSPRYMSPEQMISAKDVDARTDVWALGVILYELVTGEPVWNADTVQGLCAMIATAPTPSLRARVPAAPELLEDVIKRCLAKDRAQRLPSVADLATLLAPLATAPAQTSIDRILRVAGRSRSVPIPKPPPVLSQGPRPRAASNASMPALSQTPAKPSRVPSLPPPAGNARAVIGLGVVIALIGIGAGGMLYLNRGDAPPPAAPAAVVPSFPPAPPLPAPSAVVEAAPAVSVSAAPSASASAPKRVKHIKPATTASVTQPAEAPAPAAPSPAPNPDPDRAMTDRK